MLFFGKRKRAEGFDLRELLERIDCKRVKYVTERDLETYTETVLGKEGAINVINDEIAIFCDGKQVFRCKTEGVKLGELLSLEGVTIKGIDSETGRLRSVVAYYKYYR